jgi:hypothetical protein
LKCGTQWRMSVEDCERFFALIKGVTTDDQQTESTA